MSLTTKLLLFGAFVMVMILMSYNHTRRKRKIIFFGDSITEQGVKPGGYVSLLQSYLNSGGLNEKYDLLASGRGGNKIYDLFLRLEADILSKSVDIVVILIGVNDVWHKELKSTGTDADKFALFYEQMIQKIKQSRIKLIVCTPGVIGEKINGGNVLDNELDNYCEVIKSLAVNHHLPLVDLRASFMNYNVANNTENSATGILTTDGVHLNDQGNKLVADEIWDVLSPVIA